MLAIGAYEKCKRYIETQSNLTEQQERRLFQKKPCPCITISRQAGAGADVIGKLLSEQMNSYGVCTGEWTYFDRNLIEKVVQDHHLPKLISRYIEEDKYKDIDHIVADFLGLSVCQWTLVHKTTETILLLARMGNVIIIGRGGSVITSKLSNVFHVRLIAPVEARVRHIQEIYGMTDKEALLFIKKEDHARKSYLQSFFHRDIDDPVLYHLVINTSKMGYEGTAKIIENSVVQNFSHVLS